MANKHKLCFSYLLPGHVSNACSRQKPCRNCSGRHTTLLHPDISSKSDSNKQCNLNKTSLNSTSNVMLSSETEVKNMNNVNDGDVKPVLSECSENAVLSNAAAVGVKSVFLPILPVKVFAPDNVCCTTYALIGSGSGATFCSEGLLNTLGLRGEKSVLKLTTLHGVNTATETQAVGNLKIADLHNNFDMTIPTTFSRPFLSINKHLIPKQGDIDDYDYLNEVYLPEVDSNVDLILGQNVSCAAIPLAVIRPPESCPAGPFAVLTKLSWTVSGSNFYSPPPDAEAARSLNNYFVINNPTLCQSYVEIFDSSKNETLQLSREQERFMNHAKSNIILNDSNHFEMKLPLKNPELKMHSNKSQAMQRLDCLVRKLSKDEKLHNDYVVYMNSLIENGFAEKVANAEIDQRTDCYFMPHHGVYSAQKPDKLRVVFDCSSKFNGLSLNDNLLTGPDLSCTLLGVLLRFRQEVVPLNADIRAMFHQVQVPYQDCNYLRYLWFENGDIKEKPVEFRMKVYVFGTVASPSAANFALKETANRFKHDFSQETFKTIINNFYVDDLLKSVPTLENAINLREEISAVLSKAGFHITKWTSSKPELLATIPEDDVAPGCNSKTFEDSNKPNKMALGVQWNIKNDTFCFNINVPDKPITRRGILSMLNSIFDPMSFLTAVTLRAKILLQRLCKLNLSWDDAIPAECEKCWIEFLKDVKGLESFSLDRCFRPSMLCRVTHASLHHFCDASESAAAAVSYIKMQTDNNNCHVSLVLSKSKLAPIKRLTIPPLELLSAVLAVHNDILLRRELEIELDKSKFYTDSMISLYYLNNEKKPLKTFVANRVALIRNRTSPKQWTHIQSHLNIADMASRGVSCREFLG